jgi:hypothetical protein
MRTKQRNAERGAIIIHVAIALIALLAFSSFVVDYGVFWVSRRQAQNAADTGALAGAVSLLLDGGTTPTAKLSAETFTAQSPIWGQANVPGGSGNIVVAASGTGAGEENIPPCGTNRGCVRVDVFRNEPDRNGTVRGAALPTFFSNLVGINSQGVRATATAQTAAGNNIRCLLPFAVIDRWADNYDEKVVTTYFPNDGQTGTNGWTPNDQFQQPNGDVYIPPYGNNPNHNGWTIAGDYGRQLILKDGSPGNYSAGWANEVDLPNSTGSKDYKWNIENCNETPIGIASATDPCPAVDWEHGCVSIKTGVSQGPTSQGIGTLTKGLVGQDPAAVWNPSATSPVAGKTGAVTGGGGMSSPRVRPIVIIDINNYINRGCSGTTCIAKVANIIGFFVEGMCKDVTLDSGMACDDPNKDVVGRIVTLPGSFASGTGTVDESAAFVKVVRLVR